MHSTSSINICFFKIFSPVILLDPQLSAAKRRKRIGGEEIRSREGRGEIYNRKQKGGE
jgi:hypothetical protein